MAIQIPVSVVVPFALGVGRDILEIPLVHRAIENYFAKTSTIWDGIVWRLFEKWAKIDSPPAVDREEGLKADLVVLQEKYTEVKEVVAANPDTVTPLAAAGQAGVFQNCMPWMDCRDPLEH